MEPIREQWYQISQKWAEWTASMRNEEPKNYSELILNLPPVSVKDQTVLLRIRANGLMLSVGGGVAAAMTGFWASSNSRAGWLRLRLPITFLAGWLGSIVGSRQASFVNHKHVRDIEDPALREVMQGYVSERLTGKDMVSLRRNVFNKLDADAIVKHEQAKRDLTAREKLEHLQHEKELISGKKRKSEPQGAASTHEATSTTLEGTSPPAVIHRPRLPEAVEAERRRAAAKEGESKSDS